MVKRWIILMSCCLLAAACESPGSLDVTSTMMDAFDRRLITISSDVSHVDTSRSITITTSCLPKVHGKGHIDISGYGSNIHSYLMLESPYQDSVGRERGLTEAASTPVEFEANRTLQQRWKIRLGDNCPYYFSAGITLDSVFIADSGRFFQVASETVQRYHPNGFSRFGISPEIFTLTP
jgi:hypothetical protein